MKCVRDIFLAQNDICFFLCLAHRQSYSLFCGLFYEAICFTSCLVLFCSCDFSPFSIAITLLGEERTNFSAFRTLVRFALV